MFKENVISTDDIVQYILFLFYVDPLLDWNPKSCGDDGSALNFIFSENV